jgi:hypothetical protein
MRGEMILAFRKPVVVDLRAPVSDDVTVEVSIRS